jgi:flagellar hook-length control protein FliK
MKLPAAPLAERPAADAAPGAPQTEVAPDALFAALLNLITARTAPAEGQTPQPAPADAALADPPAGAGPADGAPAKDAPAKDAPASTAQVAAPAAAAAVLTLPVVAASTAQAPAKATQRVTPATPATPAAPAAKATPAPGDPAPAPQRAHGEHPRATTPATPATPAGAAMPATPARRAPADAPTPQPAPRATPAKAATPAQKPAADTPAPPSAAPAAAPKEVAPAKPHAAGPAEPRPVLRAERIEALVRLATRQGGAEARMELHPQELGSVVVRLRLTSDGLQATFTASNPAAVPQLQQAGDDLRRSLEAKGLTLATLDVRAQSGDAGDGRGRHRGSSQRRGSRGAAAVTVEEQPLFTSIPAGELVDVQA